MENTGKSKQERQGGYPEKSDKPTLKTISKMSGLAVATISRALNDAPDIKQSTKDKVRKIATEIGYVPNRAGVRLRTGRTNVIALVLSTEHEMMNHTARLISSLADTLRQTPFHLNITTFSPADDPMDAVKYVVENRTADAVILNQTRPDDPRVRYLVEHNFPFATHGRTDFGVEHPYYDFDNEEFSRIGVRQLVEKGCRNIVLIAPPREHSYAQHMIKGACEEAEKLNVNLSVSARATADDPAAQIQEAITTLLSGEPKIDGAISASVTATMSIVGALESAGLTVGKEFQIFTKEAVPFLKLFRSNILAISEDVTTTGAFLARAAMQAVRQPELEPMQELEIPTWDETEN